MSPALLLKLYPAMLAAFLALDVAWLGIVARGLYQRQMGHLMRPQANWGAAVPFYLIYVGAILVLCVLPAVEKGSLPRVVISPAMLATRTDLMLWARMAPDRLLRRPITLPIEPDTSMTLRKSFVTEVS